MSVHVHIEHLVVEGLGLEARGQAAFQTALAQELARVMGERGLARKWAGGIALPQVEGGALRMATPSAPAAMGREAGGSLARTLAGGGGGSR